MGRKTVFLIYVNIDLTCILCRTFSAQYCSRIEQYSICYYVIFNNCRHPIRKKSKMGSRVGGLGAAGLPADKALAGVPRLLDDLQRLSEDSDSADIVFVLGREEERVFAHRVILMARSDSTSHLDCYYLTI